ncbi:hypothetical protein VNO77_00945 [Canavalia gladiata]|uniref:Disease resistance protein RGA3 n=1 Tax=Canavalia gladiata TaxID=3824 RepID=A0AAN9MVN7_CANGL
MAEALVEIVLQNLNSLLQKELASFWGIHREVEKLSRIFTAIKAVLEDAEEQQITNHAVRDWLRKLTDSAYLLDDILDACSIQFTRLGFEGKDSRFANKVHILLSSFNPKNAIFRYNISKRIREIKERLDEVAHERQMFHLREGVMERRFGVAECRQTCSIVTQPHVYGRDDDREKIARFLVRQACDSVDLSIYPIVGIGGIGKTTLAQQVFNDERVSRHFDFKIWICVSEDFSMRRIIQSIIESLSKQNYNTLDLDPMLRQVQELLQSKAFLLVLDDVWSENHEIWERLKCVLACGSKGSSVLVTTRLARVASIMGTLPAHHLSGLSEDESWLLFKQYAFGPDREEHAHLVRIGKEIVRKCGGILEEEDVGNEVWNELYCRSFFQDVTVDELDNVKDFRLHDLVHDLALSVMGEEFLDLDDTRLTNLPKSIHHVVGFNSNGVLDVSTLKKSESLRIFLQPYKASSIISCRFPAFHSLRALRASHVYLSSLGNLIHLRYLDLSYTNLRLLPKSIYSLKKLQTLKLKACYSLCRLPKNMTRLQSLRHLIITGCDSLSHMPTNIGKMTSLRTLSTFAVGSRTGHGLAQLHLLKLGGELHIKGLQNVESGLDAKEANLIGKKDLDSLCFSWEGKGKTELLSQEVLENLQPHSNIKSLKIHCYGGVHLPTWMKNISGLGSLIVLKLYSCKNCTQLPPLGKLPSLQTLEINGMINVKYIDDSTYDYLSERAFESLRTLSLRCLPKLEMLLRDQGAQMFPLLSKLTIFDLPMLSLPLLPSVEVLEIDRCNKEVLNTISNFHRLTFLQLCYNTDMVFKEHGMMGNLYHLKTLHISEFTKLKALPIQLTNLSALEELEIKYCHELTHFPEQVLEGLCSLRILQVSYCEKFKSLSEGVKHLTSLEQLDVLGCPELLALPNAINHLTRLCAVTITDRLPSYMVPRYTRITMGPRSCCLIPDRLELVPLLHSLTLGDFDNLTSLPDCIGQLASLRRLHIRNCQHLISFPASIQKLTNLEEMNIYHCAELGKRCEKGAGSLKVLLKWKLLKLKLLSRLSPVE